MRHGAMQFHSWTSWLIVFALGILSFSQNTLAQTPPKPNVVLIFADDLGYGDVGSYGATDIATPNIDQLGAEGIRFTDFYTAPVCGPSRAMLLTGSYAQRASLGSNHTPSATTGIHSNEITLGEIMRSGGYATGIFGKWHLGDHAQFLPLQHGFDTFFGIPYSNSMWPFHPRTYEEAGEDPRLTAARDRAILTGYAGSNNPYPRGSGYSNLPLIEDNRIVEFNSDQTQFGTAVIDKALQFIDDNSAGPFFVYLPLTDPHVPLHPGPGFPGTSGRGLYGDVVEEIDAGVGRVLAKLTQLGIDNDTLVIFISDNGPWLQYGIDGGSAGVLSGGKSTQMEGGIRVPALMRWPGQLAAGTDVSEPAMSIDILPTLAGLAGATIPSDRTIDGVDMWPYLTGTDTSTLHQALFSFNEDGFANVNLGSIRSGDWKLHVSTVAGTASPTALYNLASDIGETTDQIANEPAIVATLLGYGNAIISDIESDQRPLGQVSLNGEPFAQKTGAGGGLVAVEAEHFHLREARGGKNWNIINTAHDSADGAVQALPNTGTNNNSSYESTSPHLQYRVNIDTPGRYYFWVRGQGATDSDDSIHIGLNGVALPSGYRLSEIENYWTWSSTLMSGARSYIDILTPGEQNIDIWMREDGVIIDKFVLTSDETFVPTGKGPVESEQTTGVSSLQFSTTNLGFSGDEGGASPSNQVVSLNTSDAVVTSFTIASSEPGWLSASPVSGATPENSVAVSTDTTGLTAGVYNGTITASASGYLDSSINVTLTVAGESAGFQQDAASGLLSIEVENYMANVSQGGHDWNAVSVGGASASGALQSLPNNGTNRNTGYETGSPRLDYLVNFTSAGTHYVWLRGIGASGTDDSAHVGLNGVGQASADRITGFSGSWGWTDVTMDGVRATIEVDAPGEHTLNIWMREDGLIIDKIVLGTDAGMSPTDYGSLGPDESPVGTPAPALVFDSSTLDFVADEGGAIPASQSVSLITSDTAAVAYTIVSSNPGWLSVNPAAGTTPENSISVSADSSGLVAGVYNGTITASATGFVDSSINVSLTVVGETVGFQQDPVSGLLSIEVENSDSSTSAGSHNWTAVSLSGASGSGSLQALPNNGTNNNAGYETNSPMLGYLVNFNQVGTHYVWLRGRGATSSDDSAHVGLNGTGQASADRITRFARNWNWTNDTMDNARATIEVTAPGEQMLNIWMREDGLVIDKIVLSTDAGLDPADFGALGPPESPRGAPPPVLQFGSANLSFSADAGAAPPPSQDVALDTSDGTPVSYTISSSDPSWLSASPATGTTPEGAIAVTANSASLAAGVYNGTITASATGYADSSVDVVLTVQSELLIVDDFSTDTGSWTGVESSGDFADWRVSGGKLSQILEASASVTGSDAYLRGTYAFLNTRSDLDDFEFAVEISPQVVTTSRRGDDVGIMFRYVDDDNYYRLSVNSKFGFTRLERMVAGQFSTMAVTPQGYLVDQTLRLGIRVSGSTILVYKDHGGASGVLDGDVYLAAYDGSLAMGSVALYTQSAADFDNVLIRPVSGGPQIGLVSPTPFAVTTTNVVAVQAAVLDGNGSEVVTFEVDGNSCAAPTNPQSGLFTSSCDAVISGEHTIEVLLTDSGLIDSDSSVTTGTGGDEVITLGNSITNGTADNFAADNIGADILSGGVPVGPRQVSFRGYQTVLHDSLTADPTYTVPNVFFNEGIPGDRSDELVFDRLPSILERHPNANRALVMIGTNDAFQGTRLAGIDCAGSACDDTIKGNVREAVTTLKAVGVQPVLARIPPMFGFGGGGPYTDPLNPSTKNGLIIDYNTAIAQVEAEEGLLPGPDFFDMFLAGGENRYSLFADYLHPNALGYALMAHAWKEIISPTGSLGPLNLQAICVRTSSSSCQNPLLYKQNLLQAGDQYYIDRSYSITSIPAVIERGVWLSTANNQKTNTRSDHLSFDVDREVDVYIAFMPGVTPMPNWTNTFTNTGLSVGVSAGTPSLDLYVATYPSGSTVTLGGARAAGVGGTVNNNYIVIVVER